MSTQRSLALDDALLQEQLISKDQLEIALLESKKEQKTMERALIDLAFMTERALTTFQAELEGIENYDFKQALLDADLIQKIPREIAESQLVLPLTLEDDVLRLAMVDIHNLPGIDAVRSNFSHVKHIQPVLVSETDILSAIDRYYGYEMSINGLLREIEGEPLKAASSAQDYVNPTVRLCDAIILDAIKLGASDIHFEPEGSFIRLRYRIDGVLTQVRTLHVSYWPAMCVRLKIISEMNIAESRKPQNGRFSFYIGPREVDMRVSSHPTVHGENIVIRILDKMNSLMNLEELGYSDTIISRIKQSLKKPEGIFIITGPTGCGKTTSLYSLLSYMNSPEVNIMTLEEPVEYRLPLIRQSQVREDVGMSFSEGVRSILRQDPDIILIGEIRDSATAQMGLRAAMTGHQVFATLHTNDAFGAIGRFEDLELSPSMLSGNLIAIISQRLIRKLCDHCKIPHTLSLSEAGLLKANPGREIFDAGGCEHCRNTGYKGRMAVAEILPFDEKLDDLVAKKASRLEIKEYAMSNGFVSLAEDARRRVLEGYTSLQEASKAADLRGA
ncbi:PulE/GspE-like type II secretion protein [Candidatus Bealeia paramacronuclearis]|uniref:PulE/GspE-like type II secretion protein n=1 Tax=Candidatus Bealeia paramacronuclearis TaxID=1921001 RepID=A0ABZ2C0K0_9PROT|nr:PulE/GspE-like type II secretion protein [Candidatus Bealeia paramacronuclearis]